MDDARREHLRNGRYGSYPLCLIDDQEILESDGDEEIPFTDVFLTNFFYHTPWTGACKIRQGIFRQMLASSRGRSTWLYIR
ncbi:hypothetical protein KCU64_g83, partial [Aureobasidium melanogenum]